MDMKMNKIFMFGGLKMDELTRILWEYASDCRLEGCYDQQMRREREENEAAIDQSQRKLEVLCPEQAKDLFYYLEVLRAVDMEAAFSCGLRLGLFLAK